MDLTALYLKQFGLVPQEEALDQIRSLLNEETNKERQEQGKGDTELMKLCCVQLFSKKHYEDIFLIWAAKIASFDTQFAIDLQLLCANGLIATKSFLQESRHELAARIFQSIVAAEVLDDFLEFSYEATMNSYACYYADETE